jgi:biopolymer transport protein ExbD
MRIAERTTSSEEMEIDINVIPLIDILLVLLIFFMVSSSFVASGGIDVNLPKSTTQSKARGSEDLRVLVLRDGTLQFEGNSLSEPELANLLRQKGDLSQVVVIRADELAEHRHVVRAMDAIKAAGFEKVAIATDIKR